jgi:hypothetical protein
MNKMNSWQNLDYQNFKNENQIITNITRCNIFDKMYAPIYRFDLNSEIKRDKNYIPLIRFDINGPSVYKQFEQACNKATNLSFEKKDQALEYLSKNKFDDLKLYSKDLNNSGAKSFILSTKEDMYDTIIKSKSPNYYENIECCQRVKLHFDVDYKTDISNKSRLDKLFNRLVNKTIELINLELIKHNITKPEIIILKSNMFINKDGKSKVSGHLIYNNIVFNDIYQMKFFFMTLQSDLIDRKIIDKSIYRTGSFRMLHCSKKSKNNKLKFFKGINYVKPTNDVNLFYDSLITEITNKKPYVINIANNKSELIKKIKHSLNFTKARRNSNYIYDFGEKEYVILSDLVEKLSKQKRDDYLDWILITYAFIDLHSNITDAKYKIKIYELWDNWCKKGNGYDKTNNNRIFETLSLDYINVNHIPLSCNDKFRFKKYLNYDYIKPNFEKYKCIEANEKFLNAELLIAMIKEVDVMFIKSPTGTGKTTILELLFDIRRNNGKIMLGSKFNFNKPIISITSRKNLAQKHAADLLLNSYDDKNIYMFDVDRLATTANSLIQIEEDNFKGCYVILDEISKLLRYYKSSVMNGIRADSFKIFAKIIRDAEKVIVLDADMTCNNVDTILNLKQSDNYQIYINKFQNRTGINANFYDSKHTVIQMLINDYKEKKPFITSFDSLTMMEGLLAEIKNKCTSNEDHEIINKMIKIYSSKHGSDIVDTAEWENNFVFFTPSIIYGIDYNSNQKTKSYAFAFKNILTAEDINQQIQRNRNQSEVHIYISPHISNLKYETIECFKNELDQRINKYNETISELVEINNKYIELNDIYQNKTGEYDKIIINTFNQMYVNSSFIEETMYVNNKYYLKCIMNEMGYNIIEQKGNTNYIFKLDKPELDKNKLEILNKFIGDGTIEDKVKHAIEKRIQIMNIKNCDIDDFSKQFIINDCKFIDYLHLRKFMRDDIDDNILKNYSDDFNETASNNIYVKLRYYRQLTTILKIENGIKFNYDIDKNRFEEKIADEKVLKSIDDIKKCFCIRGNKYTGFNEKYGYEVLYKMSVSICKQLFGNDLIVTKASSVKYNNIKKSTYKHYFNNNYFDKLTTFF